MADLQAVCGDCGDFVDATTVEGHMDGHGKLLPQDWDLVAWPDGTAVLVDPDTGLPA